MSQDKYDDEQLAREDDATVLLQDAAVQQSQDGKAGLALKLPGYQIVRELGTGGMGKVFLARQIEPVDREVAVKLIRHRIRNPSTEVRFLIERQALAQMRHPAIAQIYEAGTNPDGYPYFAMEYVPGLPLDQFCKQHQLGIRERLDLFIRVCQGVAHAHQKGIIHRDLKPGNILVALVDEVPSPKIIDFGIAGTAASQSERRDQVSAGTPMYMSPEQFDQAAAIDVRSDVYSLGVILYELLTDCRPYERTVFEAANTQQIHQRLLGKMPETLSRRLAANSDRLEDIARQCQMTGRGLARRLKGELSAIAMRAVHPDPDQRYGSTIELAEDVRNHMARLPVRAMGDSRSYRLRCFLRRNAFAVSSVSLIVMAMAVGTTAALIAMNEAQTQRQMAEERQLELEKMIAFQQSMLGDLEPRLLGEGFVERLRRQYAQSFDQRSDRETVQAGIEAFEIAVGQINPTDLAQDLIDEFMLKRAINSIEIDFADEPLLQAELYETVRDVYTDAGMIDLALPLAQRMIELRLNALGPDHVRTLEARHMRYRLLSRNRDFEQAAVELDQVLERMDIDAADQLTLHHNAWDSRANLLANTRQHEQALEAARYSLERAEQALGSHHGYTVRAVNTMGYVHAMAGDVETALAYFSDSAERARGRFDEDDDPFFSAMLNVGAALGVLGRYEEALAIEDEVYDILSRTYGRRHLSTLRVMNNRAHTLMDLGRHDEAESQLKAVLALGRETHGLNHPFTLTLRMTLALLYLQMEEDEAALAELSDLALWRQRLLGEDHPDTLHTQHHQARALYRLGRWADAGEVAERSFRGRVDQLGADHPATVATGLLWADINRGAGLLEEELRLRERIHAVVSEADRASDLGELMNAIRLLDLRGAADPVLEGWIETRLHDDDPSLDEARSLYTLG